VVIPNHTGDDLYAYRTESKSREEYYLRQIIGSCNYNCGTDLVDFAQYWLNYQIEHHIWPDMTLLDYRRAQPKVKALCEKMGIPYVQESVWKRVLKTKDIIVGNTTMKWVDNIGI
jgi:fatty acid desaturase